MTYATGYLQDRSEHGAQADQYGNGLQGIADTLSQSVRDHGKGHSGHQAYDQCGRHDRDERLDLKLND